MGRTRSLWVLFGLVMIAASFSDFYVCADVIPSENECRPYIEKAIHELKNVEAADEDGDRVEESDENNGVDSAVLLNTDDDDGIESAEETAEKSDEDEQDNVQSDSDKLSQENQTEENESLGDLTVESKENDDLPDLADDSKKEEDQVDQDNDSGDNEAKENNSNEENVDNSKEEADNHEDSKEIDDDSKEKTETEAQEADIDSTENKAEGENDSIEDEAQKTDDENYGNEMNEDQVESTQTNDETFADDSNDDGDSKENNDSKTDDSAEDGDDIKADNNEDSKEIGDDRADADEELNEGSLENNESQNDTREDESVEEIVRSKRSVPEEANDTAEDDKDIEGTDDNSIENDSQEKTDLNNPNEDTNTSDEANDDGDDNEESDLTIEDLTMEFEIPKNLRPREHVSELLGLDSESSIKENALKRTGDVVLKDLKRVFDNAIKPLETMYKYRDLSNRHFGDPEIFSKPLILFMGPWSGGKSTILNYLTNNEYTPNSIRSGAEPSPAYFNILMHGDEPEVLDGTQLAADWTFSGLQKFGQGLMDRLRGQKLPNKLLERVNIVEIPGILEVRKQVSRYFPFNDACQWFIDRADIIILVYDPSKLDAGPETEAILDQLKGREYQTRILLNKADQVKPEELLRVQGALIWNISPLMSSAQPPVMYTVSLWSHPYENGAPIRLLQAQEKAFLADLREAIDRRIENKIASARRFAVRIRNHAKMVDCYLTTYYNQKGLFSNKKQVADKIIEHPQNYNIYEGLSTLTNISRYDLPDPEVYLDFFRLNPLYEFKKLSETCTYFKGCPINKLDIAIAYELPELVGKYKKLMEKNLIELRREYDETCNQTEPEPPVKIIKSR